MNREEYLQLITDIGTCEDDAQRRTMLTQLTDEATTLFSSRETVIAENQRLSEQINEVQKANMNLYLQVQQQKTKEQQLEEETGRKHEEPKEKRKFEDLFDEKGGLK